jgi:hypothetical protein
MQAKERVLTYFPLQQELDKYFEVYQQCLNHL